MGRSQRDKGKRGEREWRDEVRRVGFEAHRGRQYKGTDESPDVVHPELDPLYCEVKRDKQINIHKVLTQASQEAGKGRVAYVAHRKDREGWKVTMWGEDWLELVKAWIREGESL